MEGKGQTLPAPTRHRPRGDEGDALTTPQEDTSTKGRQGDARGWSGGLICGGDVNGPSGLSRARPLVVLVGTWECTKADAVTREKLVEKNYGVSTKVAPKRVLVPPAGVLYNPMHPARALCSVLLYGSLASLVSRSLKFSKCSGFFCLLSESLLV